MTEDDRLIVTECLNIWLSEITFDSNKLLPIYENLTFVDLLIAKGLLADNFMLRNQFKDAILFICVNVIQTELPEPPSIYLLKNLLSKLYPICASNSGHTQQYFSLLNALMENYYKMPNLRQPLYNSKTFTQ